MYQFIREKSKMDANDTLKLPYFEGKRNCFIFFLKIRTRKFETIRYIKKKQLTDKKNIIKS